MRFWNKVKALVKDESGISAVEYALLLALIGAGIATAATLLGGNVMNAIQRAADDLGGA